MKKLININKVIPVLIVSILFMSIFLSSCKTKVAGNEGQSTTPSANSPAGQVSDDSDTSYVAKVGSDKISQSEFLFFVKQIKSDMENSASQSGTTDMTKFWTTKVGDKDPKETAKEAALSNLQEFKIALNQSKINNFTLSENDKSESKTSFEQLVTNNGGEKAFSDRVKTDFNITLEQFKAIYDNYFVINKYMTIKQNAFPVSDAEALKFYNENKANIDTVTVNHVLFMTVDQNTQQPLPQDKQVLAKKNADDVLAKVKAGTNIADLAKQLSEDTGSKNNGGEYVIKRDGQMVKEFEDWAFSKNVGEVGIVKTQYGYHVMKKTKANTLEEGKTEAKKEIQRKAVGDEFTKLKSEPMYKIEKNAKIFDTIEF